MFTFVLLRFAAQKARTLLYPILIWSLLISLQRSPAHVDERLSHRNSSALCCLLCIARSHGPQLLVSDHGGDLVPVWLWERRHTLHLDASSSFLEP